jgi:cytochrome c551/c552
MRGWPRRVLLAVSVLLLVAQFIPVGRANPPEDPAQTVYATISVPAETEGVLRRACHDCHSNQTVWPWYSRVAPVSWLIARDVARGRGEMNLSEWARYPARRKDRKLREICEQVTRGKMPMPVYALMHPQAKLSDQERKALCGWADTARREVGPAS